MAKKGKTKKNPLLGAFNLKAFGLGFDRGETPSFDNFDMDWFTLEDARKFKMTFDEPLLKALNFYASVYVEATNPLTKGLTQADTEDLLNQIYTTSKRLHRLVERLKKTPLYYRKINDSLQSLADLQAYSKTTLRHFPERKGSKRGRKKGQKDLPAFKFVLALADIFQEATGQHPTLTEEGWKKDKIYFLPFLQKCLKHLNKKLEKESSNISLKEFDKSTIYKYLKERPTPGIFVSPFKIS